MVHEEEALMALEAADITPQKVIDWRVNNDEFQAGESTEVPVTVAHHTSLRNTLISKALVRTDGDELILKQIKQRAQNMQA